MQFLVAWFWRHHRARYFLAVGVIAGAITDVLITLPITLLYSWTWNLTRAQAAIFVASVLPFPFVAVALGISTNRGLRATMTPWLRSFEGDPVVVRDAVLVSPQAMALRGLYLIAPAAPFHAGIVSSFKGFDPIGFATLTGVVGFAYGIVAFLIGTGIRLVNRPLLEELADAIGDDTRAPAVRTWSLRTRLMVGSLGAATATGLSAGAVVQKVGGGIQQALIVTVIGGGTSMLYFIWLFQRGLVEPSLEPLHDLKRAAERVARGDFGQRIAIRSTDELGEVGLAFNDMMRGLRERESLQRAFGSYVDPALAERLLTQDSSVFDGELVDATILFADVRNFSAYAASVEPEQAVAQLNRLFDILVPAIRAERGHPNHYTGDGLIAVWGTPEALDDHAERALRAAVVIQDAVARTFGEELRLGIGVNTGKVIAGTVGGGGKLDFTVIGDAVNIASRIEDLTKTTGDRILFTQATLDGAPSFGSHACPRGTHLLRGHFAPTHVYALET